jgi:hypothetical protein
MWQKYWHFLLKLLLSFYKNLIVTLVFEKTLFFSQKIVKIVINNIDRGYGNETRK